MKSTTYNRFSRIGISTPHKTNIPWVSFYCASIKAGFCCHTLVLTDPMLVTPSWQTYY